MLRKLNGTHTAYYSYNRQRHCIDAKVFHEGHLYKISGRHLGEVKSTLLVLANATGISVYTVLPARSA